MSTGDWGTMNVSGGMPPPPPPEPRSNGLGVAGFVISLLGVLCTCGLLAPIGLVLSALGVRRRPRGLATAGLVLGILGTLWLLGLGITMATMGRLKLGTYARILVAEADVQTYTTTHNGALPSDWKAVVTGAGHQTADAWGRELRLRRIPVGFEIRSAGTDGVFDTGDDVVIPFALPGGGPPDTQPEQQESNEPAGGSS